MPTLADGSYVVDWKVVSADSHPVHAAYTFQVGTTSTLTPGLIDQVVSNDSTGRAAGAVLALSRFLVAASIAIVVGGLAAIALEIVPPAWKLRRVIAGAGVIGAVAGMLAIPTEAAYAANKSVLGTWFDRDAWSAVLQRASARRGSCAPSSWPPWASCSVWAPNCTAPAGGVRSACSAPSPSVSRRHTAAMARPAAGTASAWR